MMKYILPTFLYCILSIYSLPIQSQERSEKVIMEIEGEKTSLNEFLDQFNLDQKQLGNTDPKTLENYLELYLYYKLKIKEAIHQGLDTTKEFLSEYKTYRENIVSNYLLDKERYEEILQELYSRSRYLIKASHILVKVDPYASPKDSLAAYKKALKLRDNLLGGADFSQLAVEFSDDTTARPYIDVIESYKSPGNKGSLEVFRSLSREPAFEDYCFQAKEGELSLPIRTKQGYHLILLEKRFPLFNKVSFDHIWISENPTKTDSIIAIGKKTEAMALLAKGVDFNEVALKYSSDQSVSSSGSRLHNIPVDHIISEYILALSKLKENEISPAFRSSFGWHIIRLVQKDTAPSYEETIASIEGDMQARTRLTAAVQSFINQQKPIRSFKEIKPKALELALLEVQTVLTDSLFSGSWVLPKEADKFQKTLFQLSGRDYTQKDFLHYLSTLGKVEMHPLAGYTKELYKEFVEATIFRLADSLLPYENKEVGKTLKNFHEGLLVYLYNEKEIWNKAITDSVGLESFYESHKNSHFEPTCLKSDAYMWSERAQVSSWTIKDNKCFDKKIAAKTIQKSIEKNIQDSLITVEVERKAIKKKNIPEKCTLLFDSKAYDKEKLEELHKEAEWKEKATWRKEKGEETTFYTIREIQKPALKNLSEAKGFYINDYQNYLDEKSLESLKQKYNYSLYPKIMNQ